MRIMLVTMFMLVGCGATPKQAPGPRPQNQAYNPESNDDEDTECKEEVPTGSLIRHTYCRDAMERDGDRKDAQDLMTKSRSQPSAVH
jgi:starvation-inducible outer membrane lipoprotein